VTADHSSKQTAGTGIDTSVPHSARIWNYWLGGKDNYEVDRAAGDQFSAIYPGIVDIARADRAFLGRVVRYLAGEAGVRQFLDVGTGLPTADNTHEVAQRVAPDSQVVYVDNDPLVLVHARALLASGPEGCLRVYRIRRPRSRPDPGRGRGDPGSGSAGRAGHVRDHGQRDR